MFSLQKLYNGLSLSQTLLVSNPTPSSTTKKVGLSNETPLTCLPNVTTNSIDMRVFFSGDISLSNATFLMTMFNCLLAKIEFSVKILFKMCSFQFHLGGCSCSWEIQTPFSVSAYVGCPVLLFFPTDRKEIIRSNIGKLHVVLQHSEVPEQ